MPLSNLAKLKLSRWHSLLDALLAMSIRVHAAAYSLLFAKVGSSSISGRR